MLTLLVREAAARDLGYPNLKPEAEQLKSWRPLRRGAMYLLSYHPAMARVFVADVYSVLDKLLGTTVRVHGEDRSIDARPQ